MPFTLIPNAALRAGFKGRETPGDNTDDACDEGEASLPPPPAAAATVTKLAAVVVVVVVDEDSGVDGGRVSVAAAAELLRDEPTSVVVWLRSPDVNEVSSPGRAAVMTGRTDWRGRKAPTVSCQKILTGRGTAAADEEVMSSEGHAARSKALMDCLTPSGEDTGVTEVVSSSSSTPLCNA